MLREACTASSGASFLSRAFERPQIRDQCSKAPQQRHKAAVEAAIGPWAHDVAPAGYDSIKGLKAG